MQTIAIAITIIVLTRSVPILTIVVVDLVGPLVLQVAIHRDGQWEETPTRHTYHQDQDQDQDIIDQ